MRYSKLDDGLGRAESWAAQDTLTMHPDCAGRLSDRNVWLETLRVMVQRVYLSLGLFKSRGIITSE